MNDENLRPFDKNDPDSVNLARELGRKGGIAAAESKREKRLMSHLMAELIAEDHNIEIKGELQTVSGEKLLKTVWIKIFEQGGTPAV
jgi:hypothetical protein